MSDARAIPGFQDFMRPLLEHLVQAGQPLRAREAYEAMASWARLTPEQREELLPSGRQQAYKNRVGWAATYLRFAGLIESPSRGTWVATPLGRELLSAHAGRIDLRVLDKYPGVRERRAAQAEAESILPATPSLDAREATPDEELNAAWERLVSSVASELQDLLRACEPGFFEQLVVDLLGRMGYGTDDESRQRVGKTADGGIDGVISLDRLGLEKVYIQAKKWKEDRTVGVPEVREFFGALAEKKASKGVFLTTTRFTREAEAYARNVSGSLILVDGKRLVSLMIQHGVGVSVARTLAVPRVDRDYFEE